MGLCITVKFDEVVEIVCDDKVLKLCLVKKASQKGNQFSIHFDAKPGEFLINRESRVKRDNGLDNNL